MKQRATLIGVGAGMVLFATFGIVPGMIAGGAVGLTVADMLFGSSANLETFRSLVAASGVMLGIIFGAAVFIGGSSIVGWLLDMISCLQSNEKKAGWFRRSAFNDAADAAGKRVGSEGLSARHVH